jgi:hypothetical protein
MDLEKEFRWFIGFLIAFIVSYAALLMGLLGK